MFEPAAKNLMLDALPTTNLLDLSLHTGFSSSGANEITGGSPAYARKSTTYSAASGGTKAASTQPVFDVPAASTVRWVGRWKSTTFLGMSPNGASPKEIAQTDTAGDTVRVPAHGFALAYTVTAATDRVNLTAHGFLAGQRVMFTGGSVPAGLTEGTVYFVVNPTTNDFQVAATLGGAAIDITGSPSAGAVVMKADQALVIYGDTAPTGLTAGTIYYPTIGTTVDLIKFAATVGGSAIDLTGVAGTGAFVSVVVEEAFAAQGTFTVTADTLSLNY